MFKTRTVFAILIQICGFALLYFNVEVYRIPILLAYIFITLLILIYFLFNPGMNFRKEKSRVSIISSAFSLDSVSSDIDRFFEIYNKYREKNIFIKVYFEKRKQRKKDIVVAMFEYKNELKEICVIEDLYTLQQYENVWWLYD